MIRKRWPLFTAIGAVLLVVAGFVIAPMLAAKPSYETYKVESTSVTKTVSANGQLAVTKLLAYGPAEQPTLISVNGSVALPVQFGASLEIKSVKVSGGVVGLIFGEIAAFLLAIIGDWTFSIRLDTIALAVGFSLVVGVAFGVWPARTASRLEPIDALRFE